MPRQTSIDAASIIGDVLKASSRSGDPGSARRANTETYLSALQGKTGEVTTGGMTGRIIASGDSVAVEMLGLVQPGGDTKKARSAFYNGSAFWLLHPEHVGTENGRAVVKDGDRTVPCPCGSGRSDGGNAGFDPTFAERFGLSPAALFATARGVELGSVAQRGLIKHGAAGGSYWIVLPKRMAGTLTAVAPKPKRTRK